MKSNNFRKLLFTFENFILLNFTFNLDSLSIINILIFLEILTKWTNDNFKRIDHIVSSYLVNIFDKFGYFMMFIQWKWNIVQSDINEQSKILILFALLFCRKAEICSIKLVNKVQKIFNNLFWTMRIFKNKNTVVR